MSIDKTRKPPLFWICLISELFSIAVIIAVELWAYHVSSTEHFGIDRIGDALAYSVFFRIVEIGAGVFNLAAPFVIWIVYCIRCKVKDIKLTKPVILIPLIVPVTLGILFFVPGVIDYLSYEYSQKNYTGQMLAEDFIPDWYWFRDANGDGVEEEVYLLYSVSNAASRCEDECERLRDAHNVSTEQRQKIRDDFVTLLMQDLVSRPLAVYGGQSLTDVKQIDGSYVVDERIYSEPRIVHIKEDSWEINDGRLTFTYYFDDNGDSGTESLFFSCGS